MPTAARAAETAVRHFEEHESELNAFPHAIVVCFFRFLFAATVLASTLAAAQPPSASANAERIEAFVREGCPHCAKAEEFLAALQGTPVVHRGARRAKEPAALARLKEIAKAQGSGSVRVPAIPRGQLIVGYSPEANTDRLIRDALARKPRRRGAAGADGAGACEAEESLSCAAGPEARPAPERRVSKSRCSAGRSRSTTSACRCSPWPWACSTASIRARCGC